ncbi:MAG: hypothetical protein LBL62_05960 [Planctomycetaceae bacterium]|nr:hypothetical protein [Planctomycetaceae bacterium]
MSVLSKKFYFSKKEVPMQHKIDRLIFLTVTYYIVILFLAIPTDAEIIAPNGAKRIETYRTSWVGNSFGGISDGKHCWVQQDIAAMCVAPCGTVYTNVPWEEAGGNCSMYKDGKMLGAAWHTHGWGYEGGKAVATNEKYVFIALRNENEGGGLNDPETWSPKGFDWHGISRRLHSDFTKGVPFDHGKGGKGNTLSKSFLVVNEVPIKDSGNGYITGLWATEDRLYVSNPLENRIEIYDTETMKKLSEWFAPEEFRGDLGQIAMDPDGYLWVLVNRPREALLGDRFLVFDQKGKLVTKKLGGKKTRYCPIEIPENWEENFPHNYHPSAFCFDNEGHLLIADAGIWHVVFFFEKNGWDYIPSQKILGLPAIGMQSGVFSEQIFRNITAIGCDVKGNIYVASNWATNGGGVVLESYAPTEELSGEAPPILSNFSINSRLMKFAGCWKLNWRLFGLCFIDCATLDPDNETMIYTNEEYFKADWLKESGKEATFVGSTAFKLNPNFRTNTAPNDYKDLFRDLRLNIGDSAGVWVRNINGRKFLFVNDMNGRFLQVYHIDHSNERIPVTAVSLFSQRHYKLRADSEPTDWLPGQPEKGEWIWRSSSSVSPQLFMSAKEFTSRETEAPHLEGWWVDSVGDVWQATLKDGIRRFRFQGFERFENPDLIGSPIWNFENLDVFPHPKEFSQVKRMRYVVETDTLYLGGCATVDGVEHKNQHWKPMGPVVCRYDNFLKGLNLGKTEGKLKWKVVLPYVKGSSGHESCEPMGFDIAGDYMFVPYTGTSKEAGVLTGRVEVYRLADAKSVGWMEPDPTTVGEIGLQDIRECLSAHRLSSGEYVVFLEDDYKAKVVMYRLLLP